MLLDTPVEIEQIKNEFQKKYDLVCFIDLADTIEKHRQIFDIFKKYHQDVFNDNQRLIFYTSYEPGQELLNHLQRAASRIDISNFFILIICPYHIDDKLSLANQKHGYDSVQISSVQRNFQNTRPLTEASFFSNYDIMCPLPFVQTMIDPDGSVRPCCKFKGTLGNVGKNPLHEIFQNQSFTDIRTAMVDGRRLSQCNVCWNTEKNQNTSLRQHAVDKYLDRLEQEWFDEVKVRDVSIAPSTICNFKCRICDSLTSSRIAVEELRFSGIAKNKKNISTVRQIDSSVTDILNTVDESIEHLHILGGDPFLWPKLETLLDHLIQNGNSQRIALEFNTNGSTYPDPLIAKFLKFKHTEILLSIDDIGSRFELQRGGKWQSILKNIILFREMKSSTVDVKLAITVNIQNVLYLDHLVQFATELDLGIVWWYLEDPHFLCIDNLPVRAQNTIVDLYKKHEEKELRSIANRVASSPSADPSEFIAYMDLLDFRRKQNWRHSHPDLASVLSADLHQSN